jgi:hypothetical protein
MPRVLPSIVAGLAALVRTEVAGTPAPRRNHREAPR